jgi:hypothetical protein
MAPEGLVYKNVNIWVGTSGFATPKNIKRALVKFRVKTSWISDNNLAGSDIKLLRWDGSKWVTLATSKKDEDSTYTYFEGYTNAFSPMAIVGIEEAITTSGITTLASPVVTAAAQENKETMAIPVKEKSATNWFVIISFMLVLVLVIYLVQAPHIKRKSG